MKRTLLIILAILAALLSGFGTSCQGGYSGPVESITIGATPIELNALIYVAEEQGYFLDNGIEIKYKDYIQG